MGGDGEGEGSGTEGLDAATSPVSRNGATTSPTIPLIVNTSVSTSVDVALAAEKVKLTVSPFSLAYTVIRNIDLPTYGPKGDVNGVSCTPRTLLPT